MGVKRMPGHDVKELMVEAVKRYGYEPKTHDEADAIAIRLYVLHELHPETRRSFALDLGALGASGGA